MLGIEKPKSEPDNILVSYSPFYSSVQDLTGNARVSWCLFLSLVEVWGGPAQPTPPD